MPFLREPHCMGTVMDAPASDLWYSPVSSSAIGSRFWEGGQPHARRSGKRIWSKTICGTSERKKDYGVR